MAEVLTDKIVGYHYTNSTAYRFDDEGENPKIAEREPSETLEDPKLSLAENLRIEKDNAIHQVKHIKKLLDELRQISERRLAGNPI